ncbi:uncharacterized protein LOC126676739 [Mercurialis annua]|uniref:uncharacterized protein LOC126676739 n=1 Tax=Mercurialis annua TaxID=3986 RepID=UPI00215E9793|nr:uncharacterized protein LOC126676739 [Mercurialis annua]
MEGGASSSLPESHPQPQPPPQEVAQPQQFQEQAATQEQQQEAILQYQKQQQEYQDYYNYYYQTYDQSSSASYYPYYQQQYPPQWPQYYDPQQQNYAYYQQQPPPAPPDYYQQQQPPQPQQQQQQPPQQQQQQPPQQQQQQPPQQQYYHQQPPPPAVAVTPISDSGGATQPQAPLDGGNGKNAAAAAAIAALEQLAQFAGTMDAAERAIAGLPPVATPRFQLSMRPPADGRHLHRGGGRRGGGPLRGGRRGNTGQYSGSAPPFRGKGRGKGNAHSRSFQAQGVISTSSYPDHPAAAVEAGQSARTPENVAFKQGSAQIAWCEICRVDCTSLEILEQHKNGKRHKKNLLRNEEVKEPIKPGEEIQNDHKPVNDLKPEVSQETKVAQDGEEQKSAENLTSEAASDEPIIENNQQDNAGENIEAPAGELSNQKGNKRKVNSFDNRRRGGNHKIRGGRGGKRVRTSETNNRFEPPKPKVVIPLLCDLCNVKCDTREVLDRHFAGKKHIAKLNRFQGHQSVYGPTGLQALYPPNPVAQTHFVLQGHQPFYPPQGLFPPQFPSQAHHSTAAAPAILDPQFSQSFVPQQSEATSTANPAAAVFRL